MVLPERLSKSPSLDMVMGFFVGVIGGFVERMLDVVVFVVDGRGGSREGVWLSMESIESVGGMEKEIFVQAAGKRILYSSGRGSPKSRAARRQEETVFF